MGWFEARYIARGCVFLTPPRVSRPWSQGKETAVVSGLHEARPGGHRAFCSCLALHPAASGPHAEEVRGPGTRLCRPSVPCELCLQGALLHSSRPPLLFQVLSLVGKG